MLSLASGAAVGVGIDCGFRRIRAVVLDAAHQELASDSMLVSTQYDASEGMPAAEALAQRMLTVARTHPQPAAVAVCVG